MHNSSLITQFLQWSFQFLPLRLKCMFGNCKTACTTLAFEDDIENPKSLKLRAHLSICKDCSTYYRQMRMVNSRISKEMQERDEFHLDPQILESQMQKVIQDNLNN